MSPTTFEIGVAIVMVAVTVAIFVLLRRSMAADSARRMMGMMMRVGVDTGITPHGDSRTKAILKEARRRRAKCPREDLCDRWLGGKAEGDNTFCSNAPIWSSLSRTGAQPV